MKEVRIGQPLSVNNVTIIPLEEITVSYKNNHGALMFYVSKKPLGVVIATPQKKWAIGIEGETIDPETCSRLAPVLRQVWADYP